MKNKTITFALIFSASLNSISIASDFSISDLDERVKKRLLEQKPRNITELEKSDIVFISGLFSKKNNLPLRNRVQFETPSNHGKHFCITHEYGKYIVPRDNEQ